MVGPMVRSFTLTALVLVTACPTEPASSDTGPRVLDAGQPSDVGSMDAGTVTDPDRCEENSDCRDDQRCSLRGRCYTGDCYEHGDCPPEQRCSKNRCIPRPETELGLVFERRFPNPGSSHFSRFPTNFSDGFGGALLDVDGDGDLDLYLGSHVPFDLQPEDRPACLYSNESTPSELILEPVGGHCEIAPGFREGGQGIDVDADGRHELLITGNRTLLLQRFYPTEEIDDLLAEVPDDDPRSNCNVATALPIDLDLDGRIDLYVACQTNIRASGPQGHVWMSNIPMRQTADGSFQVMSGYPWDDLVNGGNTLAIGAVDIDHNGMIDLVLANDSFTTLAMPELVSDTAPGLVILRSGPDEDLPYPLLFFGQGNAQSGSYMGVANLFLEGFGDHIFLSDFGPNRLVSWDANRRPVDRRVEWGVDLPGSVDEQLLFAWGALADDFNRDGKDDLFLTQGIEESPGSTSTGEEHFDVIFLQREGRFETYIDEVGISRHDHLDSGDDERFYSSRGAVKADLDQDGYLEIIGAAFEGRPRFHSEVPLPSHHPRCTLKPIDRYVPTFGIGHAYRDQNSPSWRRWDVSGQLYFGTSPWPIVPWQTGRFRFASGYETDFNCAGQPGPVELREPEWLELKDGEIHLDLQWMLAPPSAVKIAYRSDQETRIEEHSPAPRLALAPQPGEHSLMVALDSRWIARWFELP